MAKLVYPQLSYKLMGILFKIHNDLGPSYTEKQYQKAIAIQLKNNGISHEKEKKCYYLTRMIILDNSMLI